MTARVIQVDPSTDARWDDFLARQSEARLCHSSSWLDILQRTYGYLPVHLAYEVDGTLHGVLPLVMIRSPLTGKRLVSLPFSGPAGPVGTSPEAVDALLAAAVGMTSDLRCSYLNIQSTSIEPREPFNGFARLKPFVTSVIPLQAGARELWRHIPVRTVRQDINRGKRRGVSVRVADRKQDVSTFYELFVQTSRKHGMPPQPYELFDIMWDVLRPQQMLHLFLAVLNDRVINALLCFTFRDVLSVGYVGTDYRFLRYHPVKVTDWAAIEWACDRGYGLFDFLQSHVKNDGLRWYKRSFGAVERPVAYYYYPKVGTTAVFRELLIGGRTRMSKAVKAVVRRLPTAGLKILGNTVYKHMG